MAGIKIGKIVLGMCQTNCYFVYREGEKEVLVFDPADQGAQIEGKLKTNGLEVAAIFLTHGHFDHILGCDELKKLTGAKVYANRAELALCESPELNVSGQMGRRCSVTPDILMEDGEELTIAGITLKMIATPGHTEGGCCYYIEEAGFLVSGDTLFEQSVGRTDFPTGSMGTLVRSIKEKLFVLPEDVKVYPGHGDATSIGVEKVYNPFCG